MQSKNEESVPVSKRENKLLPFLPILEIDSERGKCFSFVLVSGFQPRWILLQGRDLLLTMNAMERYPAKQGDQLMGASVEDNYSCAEEFKAQNPSSTFVGTISKEEWEALTIYQIFAFKKLL